MPSHLHEALLLLFRNRPALAPELLRDTLHVVLPPFSDVRIDSAEVTDIEPAEYRADLVILLLDGVPVYGIVIEVQLQSDARKHFVWPVYVTNLRARLKLPVGLFVVAADDATARWAATPIDLGGGNTFVPLVIGPSGVPEVADTAQARADPELAVLSAIAHGRDPDSRKAARIADTARDATQVLDPDRRRLYLDLVLASLSEAAKRELKEMDPAKYEYQSDFAKQYIALGKQEGKLEGSVQGRVELVSRQLARRFGPLTAEVSQRVAAASIAELDAIGDRLLTAESLDEALGQL